MRPGADIAPKENAFTLKQQAIVSKAAVSLTAQKSQLQEANCVSNHQPILQQSAQQYKVLHVPP